MGDLRDSIWQSRVNSFLGILFIGSFAFGAGLLIWHAAYGENPVANAFAAEMAAETGGSQ